MKTYNPKHGNNNPCASMFQTQILTVLALCLYRARRR